MGASLPGAGGVRKCARLGVFGIVTITALLGPTNTGKTHKAVERMLEHPTGMIGLPLRLLAREVYDRITARVGEARVALVTGEEKRVPRRPDYWVCTVEAMPLDREVDFVAIDEIQLAAHDQRGHVFTDRLLHARGRVETMFLGAGTMAHVLATLAPTAKIASHPRLSRLTFAGTTSLGKLPPRSAVVGFSVNQTYELAERLRARRGGAAVVLGALSPRTRNAQVALFQSGEVDYMVATDAIGMGLNLDVRHVSFASLRKFDGNEVRELEAPELAQIAGRAGRYTEDGTFGALSPLLLPESLVHAIESHRFPAVRRVIYRSSDLDFASIETLLQSLKAPPPLRILRPVANAEDTAALTRLASDDEVRGRARGAAAVSLLWDVCQIPDYRKLLFESHVAFLRELYMQLTSPRRELDPSWVRDGIAELDDTTGPIDSIVARIATVRLWTYVCNRDGWVRDAEGFQAQAHAVEDRLSDALHEALVQRFVERGGRSRHAPASAASAPKAAPKSAHAPHPRTGSRDEASGPAKGHPFAALAKISVAGSGSGNGAGWVTGLAGPHDAAARDDAWVARLAEAPHEAFSLDANAEMSFEGRVFAWLVAGSTFALPDVRLRFVDELGAGARTRMLRRAIAWARDAVGELLEPLRAVPHETLLGVTAKAPLSAAARGLLYQLEAGLGTVTAEMARVQLAELGAGDAEALARRGVVLGSHVVFHPALLTPRALTRRRVLALARMGAEAVPRALGDGAPPTLIKRTANVDDETFAAVGYPVFGGRAVRADVAQRLADTLRSAHAVDRGELARVHFGSAPRRDTEAVMSALAQAPT